MKVLVNARNRAYSFETRPEEKILYAGLRSEIDLPYECATGTCGTCRARLIEGSVRDPWPDAPGHKYIKPAQGEFLMCQCEAETDLTVEVANYVYAMDPGATQPVAFRGTITECRQLTEDVVQVIVGLDAPCDFDAGQFISVAFPGVPGFRGYSMVNYERRTQRLVFVIKNKPGGGVSEKLFNENLEGSPVELYGPLGHATFYPSLQKNLLCIAGGSGIAGMMAILERGAQEHYFAQFQGHVFFGVRTLADAFYLDELANYKRQFPDKLHITVAFSREPEVPDEARRRWPDLEFTTGYVHEVAGQQMKGKYQNIRAYLAGPPPAVEAAIRMLLMEARLTTDNIRYDKFS